MIMINKIDLQNMGFKPFQSGEIIRKAKRLMVNKGYGYYENKRLGVVPRQAVEEVLGISLDEVK